MKRIHYGWVICFACTLMLFVTIGMVANNFTVFMPFVKENYGFTHTQTSSLVTIRCMISFLSMWFTGLYYEKVDIRVGTALAVLFAGIGYMIFSISTTYEMFCVGTAISGMGYGLGSMIPVSILIEHWFIAHKALALSICATGSGIAMIILNSPSSVNPFRQTFFVPADCPISDGPIPIFSIGFGVVFPVRHPNKRKPPHRDCAAVLMINVQQRKIRTRSSLRYKQQLPQS